MKYRFTHLLILFIFSSSSWAYDYTVELTEAQLQQQLASMMPITKEKMFVTVTLSKPALELGVGGDKIGVFSNLDISAPGGIKGTGRAKVEGRISYKKQTGEFFLYNPTISQIEIDQIPNQFHSNVKQLAQLALNSSIKGKPIFTLTDNNSQEKLAKSMLKSVKVEPGKILITLAIAEN